MERVGGRWEKMEGHCSTGQSPQWAVVPMEEEEEVNQEYSFGSIVIIVYMVVCFAHFCLIL